MKKKGKIFGLVLIAMIFSALILTACGGGSSSGGGSSGGGTTTKYTVTFDTDGGSANPGNQSIKSGGKITAVAAPTKEGYTFVNWIDKDTNAVFVPATSTITKDTNLKATWQQATGGPGDGDEEDDVMTRAETTIPIQLAEFVNTLLTGADKTVGKFVSYAETGVIHVEADIEVDVSIDDGDEIFKLLIGLKANINDEDNAATGNSNTAAVTVSLATTDNPAYSEYLSIYTEDSKIYVGERISSDTMKWFMLPQLDGTTPQVNTGMVVYFFKQFGTLFEDDWTITTTKDEHDVVNDIRKDYVVTDLLDALGIGSYIGALKVLTIAGLSFTSDNPYYEDGGTDGAIPTNRSGDITFALDGTKVPGIIKAINGVLPIKDMVVGTPNLAPTDSKYQAGLDAGLQSIISPIVQLIFNVGLSEILDPTTVISQQDKTTVEIVVGLDTDDQINKIGLHYANPKSNEVFGLVIPKIDLTAQIKNIVIAGVSSKIAKPASIPANLDRTTIIATAEVSVPHKDLDALVEVYIDPAIKVNVEKDGNNKDALKVSFAALAAEARITLKNNTGTVLATATGIYENTYFYFDLSEIFDEFGVSYESAIYKFQVDIDSLIHSDGVVGTIGAAPAGAEADGIQAGEYKNLFVEIATYIQAIVDTGKIKQKDGADDILGLITDILDFAVSKDYATGAAFPGNQNVLSLLLDLIEEVVDYAVYGRDGSLFAGSEGAIATGTSQSIVAAINLGDVIDAVIKALDVSGLLEEYGAIAVPTTAQQTILDIVTELAKLDTPWDLILSLVYENILIGNEYEGYGDFTAEDDFETAKADVAILVKKVVKEYSGIDLDDVGDIDDYLKSLTLTINARFNGNGAGLDLVIKAGTATELEVKLFLNIVNGKPAQFAGNKAVTFTTEQKAAALDLGLRSGDGEKEFWPATVAIQDELVELLKLLLEGYQAYPEI
ncbi:MAG: InlB B-repeat-containing protein [Christensenellaceae bacterium]|jgi:uncharacterized repeat protein (TIGR02543 family)|nr:InlB B-repeat-containing protein [Christensenellaceae bacterium]